MSTKTTEAVKNKYGAVAVSNLSSDQEGVKAVAEAFGYTPYELASIPAEANMGLSCGNPTATANLKPGQVVIDLGSGGGLDVFLAAQKVGPTGKAIGIDMTPEMVELAKKNTARANDGKGYDNVEFHLATIDDLPLADSTADIVISNCVINLAPDKPAVFREIARVLKPGGGLAVSDIVLKKELPQELGENVLAYVGCIAGAITIDDYKKGLADAGLTHVEIIDSGADLNAYAKAENTSICCPPPAAEKAAASAASSCCTPATDDVSCCTPTPISITSSCCSPAAESPTDAALHDELAALLRKYDVNDYAASVKIFAVKT
ncbi:MAG: arsenite methyltransferase [Acidobacteriota bacterium]